LSKLFDAIDWDKEYVAEVGSEPIEESLSAFADKTKDAQYEYKKVMKSTGRRDTHDSYEIDYQCPICKQGTTTFWKDTTIGFKTWGFIKCTKCGFDIYKLIDAMRK